MHTFVDLRGLYLCNSLSVDSKLLEESLVEIRNRHRFVVRACLNFMLLAWKCWFVSGIIRKAGLFSFVLKK